MGHFNVLKGQHPGLKQNDRALPIKTGESDIVRGSVLVEDNGTFRKSTTADAGSGNTPGAIPFFCLQGQADPDVHMAGHVVNALSGTGDMQIETNQYKVTDTYQVGTKLAVADGVLAAATDDQTVVGIVTKKPYVRWSNNEQVQVAGQYGGRTGGRISCIAFQTVYIPNLSTSV